MPARRKPLSEYVERECPACATVYLANPARLRHGRSTTCSRACSYTLRGREAEDRVQLVCAVCSNEFTRPPSHVKGKHGADFCSRDCHYIGRSLGITRRVVTQPYRYTEGGRTRLSETGARTYARGASLPYPESELALADTLARLGVPFVHQHVFVGADRSFVADFYLPDRDLVIEIDGAEHRSHARVRARDAELDRLVTEAGLRIARVPDNGVPHEVVQAALRLVV